MKFKSDIEVQAGIKDSAGNPGTTGQVLSSNGTTVSWVDGDSDTAHTVLNQVKAGVAINKGQAVYVTSADGTNIIVGLASNTSEATSSKTLGLLDATVAINGFANVVQIGRLAGLNTIGATVGDPVWLGQNGNLIYGLANKPYAPLHLVFIGIVTRVNSNNGEIFVNVQNGFELNEIHDVDIKTNVPINGDILGYDGTLWVNKTVAEWLGYTPADQAITISTTAPLSGGGDLSANRTLSIAQANATTNGYLSSADWTNFNDKQTALNGTGFVKASGTTISYDNSTYVPTSRTITINGVTQDLSANQAWTVSGGIDGSGTVNTLSKFTGTTTIGDSQIKDSGTSVSIGYTTNPSTYKLDVNGDVNINTDLYVSGTFPYTIKAAGGVNVDDALGVYWKTDVGGIGGTLAGIGQSSSGLDFYTNSSLLAPKLRILANGNVTIGTLAGSGTRTVVADANGVLSTTTGGTVTGSGSVGQVAFWNGTSSITGESNLFWDSTGDNLGIGTAIPSRKLHVSATGNNGIYIQTTNEAQITMSGYDSTNSIYYCGYDGTGLYYSPPAAQINKGSSTGATYPINYYSGGDNGNNSYLSLQTQASEKMRITSGGNVGIGTKTVPNTLSVAMASSTTGKGISLTSSAGIEYARFGVINSTVDNTSFIGSVSNNNFAIYANNAERMRIFSSGNVFIGSSPVDAGYKLDVNGPGRFSGKVTASDLITYGIYGPDKSNIDALNTKTDGTAGFISLVGHSGNTSSPYRWGGISGGKTTAVGDGNYGGYLSLWTTSGGENSQADSASYERMRVTSAGNVIIGGTTPRAKLDVEGYTSFVSISAGINSEATTVDQQLAGVDFRKHYALAIGASIRLLQSGGVNNYSPSHLAFYTNDGTTSFGNVPPERMRIASSGNILINTQTDAGYKLNVNGDSLLSGYSKAYTGILNSDNYFEKVFSDGISFTNGVANSAADIRFGNTSFWGYIEIEITATFSNQNSAGKLTKVFAVGTNPNGYIYNDEGRVVDAMGSIADNIAIGNFTWDAANTTFRIPISHIVASGNNYTVKVRMFTHSSGAWTAFNVISIGPKYTLTALPKQYPYYNDRLGIGTASPSFKLQVEDSSSPTVAVFKGGGGGAYSTFNIMTLGANDNGYWRAPTIGSNIKMVSNAPAINVTGFSASAITFGADANQGRIGFFTTSSNTGDALLAESLRINTTGNVLINTTTDAGFKLDVNGTARVQTSLISPAIGANATPNSTYPVVIGCTSGASGLKIIGRSDNLGYIEFFNNNGTTVNSSLNGSTSGLQVTGATTFSSTVTATGFFQSSDIRLKEIVNYDYSVSDIKPISYLWKDLRDNKKHVGYSAQEVQKVMPDAVNEDADGILSVNYIEVLVAKIAELENRIKQLEK